MIGLLVLAAIPVAFIALGIYCAFDNHRHGRDVGSDR